MGWSGRLRRLALRWLAAYLLLYMLPWVYGAEPIRAGIRALTLWVVHLAADPTYQPPVRTGSGDTLLDWFQIPVLVVLSGLAVAVWSAVDGCRRYHRVTKWATWVACRYFLAGVMAGYGMAKVLRLQFPEPGPTLLLTSYADSSPMGLLWRFMGHSGPYTIFAGLAEVIGALLLLSRRTATLGALVLIGVLANVVVLNLAYDVPVKLLSTHLLLIAVGVAAADWRRLWALFASERSVPSRDLSPPLVHRRAVAAMRVAKVLALLYIVWIGVLRPILHQPPPQDRPALYGVHEIQSDDRSPAVWTRIVVERGDWLAVWTTSGERILCSYTFDGDTIEIQEPDGFAYVFDVVRPTPDTLELHRDGAVLRLKRRDPSDFLLNERGFHWVSEYPFNR